MLNNKLSIQCSLLLAVTCGLVFPLQAFADGCFVAKWDKKSDISEPRQKAIIVYDEGVEDLILQVRYAGPVEEFGWLVPVPSKPTVEKASIESFYYLSRLVQSGLTSGRHSLLDSDKNVEVYEYKTIGAYEIATLKAHDSEGLAAWMKDHDFRWPTEGNEIIQGYIDAGWCFVAVKVNLKANDREDTSKKLRTGELHPLKLTFETSRCVYPLKISSLNKGSGRVDVYMISREPYVCTDMDFFLGQISNGLARYTPFFGQFEEAPLLMKDVPRLKGHKWYLYKHSRLFQPSEMHDLTFRPVDHEEINVLAEEFFSSTIPASLSTSLSNKMKNRIAAASYLAPKVFERSILQLCRRKNACNSMIYMSSIDWSLIRSDPDPIAVALANAWVNAKLQNQPEWVWKADREAHFSYLVHMKQKASAGIPILAREITRNDMIKTYREHYVPFAKFLKQFPDKEATGLLVDLFRVRRASGLNTWVDPDDFRLLEALGLTGTAEAALVISPYLSSKIKVSEAATKAILATGYKKNAKCLVGAIRECGLSEPRKYLFNALRSVDEEAAFELLLDWIDDKREGQEDVVRRLAEHRLADEQVAELCSRTSKLWQSTTTDGFFRRHAKCIEKSETAGKSELKKQLKTLVAMRKRLAEPVDNEPIDRAIAAVTLRLYN